MAIATYTKTGSKATTPAKLDKTIFSVEIKNHDLVKSAYVAYMANGRDNLAKTKTRGLVRGGGRKPWRQKGTGRARFGSIRNPIWKGGGIVFGPTGNENYSKSLNVKANKQAVRQALTMAQDSGKVVVIEDLAVKEAKTSEAAKLLNKLGLKRNILIVVDQKSDELIKSTRNLSNVKLVSTNYVNVYDVMNADCIMFTAPALTALSQRLGKDAK